MHYRCEHPCNVIDGVLCDGKGDCPIPVSGPFKWSYEPGFPADECLAVCFHPSVPSFRCTSTSIALVSHETDVPDVLHCDHEVM